MKRAYYDDSITNFLISSPEEIIGKIALKERISSWNKLRRMLG